MTCAKKIVKCEIVCRDGSFYVGTNDCANPQAVCPREEGEGYDKCKSICQQYGHAEEMAISAAKAKGSDLNEAIIAITGIDNFCKSCQKLIYSEGIRTMVFYNEV